MSAPPSLADLLRDPAFEIGGDAEWDRHRRVPYWRDVEQVRGPIGNPTATALLLSDKWQGADRNAKAQAIEAERAGMHRDDIWRKYLWGRIPGGHWVTESDDSRWSLSPKVREAITEGERTKLPQSLEEMEDARARRVRFGDPAERPEFYGHATFPDEDVSRGDPTLRFRGPMGAARPAQGITRFETLEGSNFAAHDPEKTSLSLGTYLGSNVGKTSTSIGIGEPQFPFRGLPLKAIMGTLVHERRHKADDLGGIASPDPNPDVYPELRPVPYSMLHDYYADEAGAEGDRARKDMTMAQRRATPPWHTYPVPEDMQIYFNPKEKRWVVPEKIVSDPLGKFAYPAMHENYNLPEGSR